MSKLRKTAIIINVILIVLTVSFIWRNSLKDVSASTADSEGVTEIVEKSPPIAEAIEKNKITSDDVEVTVRSLAHIVEFAALGALSMLLILIIDPAPFGLWVISSPAFCLIIGIIDECLQLLSDRACELNDIIKDLAGGMLGGLFVLAVFFIARKSYKKQEKERLSPDRV